jgi:hypothetical protein
VVGSWYSVGIWYPEQSEASPLPGSTVATDETKDLAAVQPTVNRREARNVSMGVPAATPPHRRHGKIHGAMSLFKALVLFGFMDRKLG